MVPSVGRDGYIEHGVRQPCAHQLDNDARDPRRARHLPRTAIAMLSAELK